MSDQDIVITREFDAPRGLAFKAWTEPGRMKEWFGPTNFTLPHCTIDLRVGGLVHFCMRSPDGQDIWCRGIYREIVEPSRIVSTDSFSDKDGNVVDPSVYGMKDWPAEALITLTFEEHAGGTTVTVRHTVPGASAAAREECRGGWSETLDRLAAYMKDAR
jgi:uncharacterized protein YndB with AHSA1/START domain